MSAFYLYLPWADACLGPTLLWLGTCMAQVTRNSHYGMLPDTFPFYIVIPCLLRVVNIKKGRLPGSKLKLSLLSSKGSKSVTCGERLSIIKTCTQAHSIKGRGWIVVSCIFLSVLWDSEESTWIGILLVKVRSRPSLVRVRVTYLTTTPSTPRQDDLWTRMQVF